jgi:hypothetical protein
MDRNMNQDSVGPLRLETPGSLLATMGGAVVHYPENSWSRPVRFFIHDLAYKGVNWHNAILDIATTKKSGIMDVPFGEISPSSGTIVLMLDPCRTARPRWQRRMPALSRLYAGFSVGRYDEFRESQFPAVPNSLIQVQHSACFFSKLRVTRKDPTAMPPWLECVSTQPPPQCCATDFGSDALRDHLAPNISRRKSRQRQAQTVWKFTSQSFYLDYDAGGKSGPTARRAVVLQGLVASPGKTVSSIYSQFAEGYRDVRQ